MNDKFIGKLVAVRGIGSGVNVGRVAAHEGIRVLFQPGSFFCSSWEYPGDSFGAFHSLANGKIKGGTITLVKRDTIIEDAAQIVICDDAVEQVLAKFAKE